jgi:hypothetical protein
MANPKVQEYERDRARQPARKTRAAANVARWNAEHPLAYWAHYLTSNAVRDGRLFKQPYVVCGATEKLHAHHRDYSKPLEVTWLCAQCHTRIHAAFPELAGHRGDAP